MNTEDSKPNRIASLASHLSNDETLLRMAVRYLNPSDFADMLDETNHQLSPQSRAFLRQRLAAHLSTHHDNDHPTV